MIRHEDRKGLKKDGMKRLEADLKGIKAECVAFSRVSSINQHLVSSSGGVQLPFGILNFLRKRFRTTSSIGLIHPKSRGFPLNPQKVRLLERGQQQPSLGFGGS